MGKTLKKPAHKVNAIIIAMEAGITKIPMEIEDIVRLAD